MTEQQNMEYSRTSKALKTALRGLDAEQVASLIAGQDKAYDSARSEGFDDFTATMFSFNLTSQGANALKKRSRS